MFCLLLCPTHLAQHTCAHICRYTYIHMYGHTHMSILLLKAMVIPYDPHILNSLLSA